MPGVCGAVLELRDGSKGVQNDVEVAAPTVEPSAVAHAEYRPLAQSDAGGSEPVTRLNVVIADRK